MAQKTQMVASFLDGLVYAEVDYNDANMNITRVRVVNKAPADAYMWVELDPPISGISVIGRAAPARQTVQSPVGNNTARLGMAGTAMFCRYPAA